MNNKPHEHVWTPMDWQEAYPASSGKKCACGVCKLGWFCDINEPGGDKKADAIIEALTGKAKT